MKPSLQDASQELTHRQEDLGSVEGMARSARDTCASSYSWKEAAGLFALGIPPDTHFASPWQKLLPEFSTNKSFASPEPLALLLLYIGTCDSLTNCIFSNYKEPSNRAATLLHNTQHYDSRSYLPTTLPISPNFLIVFPNLNCIMGTTKGLKFLCTYLAI